MVITGADKGKTGKVLRVLTDKDRVVVEGINRVWKHVRPIAAESAGRPHPEGRADPHQQRDAAGSDHRQGHARAVRRCATARSIASPSSSGTDLGTRRQKVSRHSTRTTVDSGDGSSEGR